MKSIWVALVFGLNLCLGMKCGSLLARIGGLRCERVGLISRCIHRPGRITRMMLLAGVSPVEVLRSGIGVNHGSQ